MNSRHLRLIAKQHEETAALLRRLADQQDALPIVDDVLAKHPATLNLGVRFRKMCVREGIETIGDLCCKSFDEVLQSKNFGITGACELREKLQEVLNKELSNADFSSDEFANAVGMSRMQLHRKLKTLLGVSATEFLRKERLKMAATLLKTGNGNVSEIIYALVFNDVSYFNRCFKEMYHCTPSEYQLKK